MPSTAEVEVPVSSGQFEVNIGALNTDGGDPGISNCDFSEAYYVELKVNTDNPMEPRLPLVSVAWNAARAVAAGDEDLALTASLAAAFCSQAFVDVAGDNIQVHGGVGFTWEHPASLYYKRAKASEVLLGTPTHHRESFATAIGI